MTVVTNHPSEIYAASSRREDKGVLPAAATYCLSSAELGNGSVKPLQVCQRLGAGHKRVVTAVVVPTPSPLVKPVDLLKPEMLGCVDETNTQPYKMLHNTEVVGHVLLFLDYKSEISLSTTCKDFHGSIQKVYQNVYPYKLLNNTKVMGHILSFLDVKGDFPFSLSKTCHHFHKATDWRKCALKHCQFASASAGCYLDSLWNFCAHGTVRREYGGIQSRLNEALDVMLSRQVPFTSWNALGCFINNLTWLGEDGLPPDTLPKIAGFSIRCWEEGGRSHGLFLSSLLSVLELLHSNSRKDAGAQFLRVLDYVVLNCLDCPCFHENDIMRVWNFALTFCKEDAHFKTLEKLVLHSVFWMGLQDKWSIMDSCGTVQQRRRLLEPCLRSNVSHFSTAFRDNDVKQVRKLLQHSYYRAVLRFVLTGNR